MNNTPLEQLHNHVQAPQRAEFRDALRTQLVQAAREQVAEDMAKPTTMNFKKLFLWLTVPTATFAVVALGIFQFIKPSNTPQVIADLPILNPHEVVAESIEHFISESSSSVIKYIKTEHFNDNRESVGVYEEWSTIRENITISTLYGSANANLLNDINNGEVVEVCTVDASGYSQENALTNASYSEDEFFICDQAEQNAFFKVTDYTINVDSVRIFSEQSNTIAAEPVFVEFVTDRPLKNYSAQVSNLKFTEQLAGSGFEGMQNEAFNEPTSDGKFIHRSIINGGMSDYVSVESSELFLQISEWSYDDTGEPSGKEYSNIFKVVVNDTVGLPANEKDIASLQNNIQAFIQDQLIQTQQIGEASRSYDTGLDYVNEYGTLIESNTIEASGKEYLQAKYIINDGLGEGYGMEFLVDLETRLIKSVDYYLDVDFEEYNTGYTVLEYEDMVDVHPDEFFTEDMLRQLMRDRNLI